MKPWIAGAILSIVSMGSFAGSIIMEEPWHNIAKAGVISIASFLLWMCLLLVELNDHFEKEEMKDEKPE